MSIKYRLKEVATDFGMQPKQIAQIMEKFFEKPKSNTQVLTEEELNIVTTPIGMEIDAETPAEIAVSIAGQMIQVRARRNKA